MTDQQRNALISELAKGVAIAEKYEWHDDQEVKAMLDRKLTDVVIAISQLKDEMLCS